MPINLKFKIVAIFFCHLLPFLSITRCTHSGKIKSPQFNLLVNTTMTTMTVRLLIILYGFITVAVVHIIGIGGRFYLPGIVVTEAFSFPLVDHNTHNNLLWDNDRTNSDVITNRIDVATSTATTPPSMFDYSRNIPPPIDDTTPCEVITDKDFYFPSKEELSSLPKGDQGGYHIVRQYIVSPSFMNKNNNSNNIPTLQFALTVLDPVNYPTLSKARKACRKGMILVQVDDRKRRMDGNDYDNDNANDDSGNDKYFQQQQQPQEQHQLQQQQQQQQQQRGKVGDFVFSGDVISCQMFLGNYSKKQCYPNITYEKPQFNVPVLYEDDHVAVLNKPAGIAVYSDTRNSSGGKKQRRTIHFLLPFILIPPKKGTEGGILRRPGIVHRIDKPTSGILVIAKTKIAMQSLHEQFRTRKIQKIYTAIINGDIQQQVVLQHQQCCCNVDKSSSHLLQGENDNDNDRKEDLSCWNVIDYPLGGKYAITSWKLLRKVQSLNAKDGILSKIEIRLETGRYHQIRRHFSWLYRRPLVGDHLYAGLLQAHHFRSKGLYLCSNGISFHHPIMRNNDDANDETVIVEVTIDLPKRFDKLMNAEESWALYDHSC